MKGFPFIISGILVVTLGVAAGMFFSRPNPPHNKDLLCIDNLKHIGAAALLYAEDNNELLPPITLEGKESLVNHRSFKANPQQWKADLVPYTVTSPWFCPVTPIKDGEQTNYHLASQLMPKDYGSTNGAFVFNVKLHAKTPWLTDGVFLDGDDPATFHGKKCNVLLGDGTVRTLNQ